jgi:hypothetical protein
MDALFYSIVVPVLMEGWPGLSKVEIRGVKKPGLMDLEAKFQCIGVRLEISEEVVACRHI